MSIDAEEFDRHKNPTRYILEFLRENSGRAFTAEYIAQKIEVSEQEVRTAIMWENLAGTLDRTYRSQIESVSVRGITYYKYKG